MNKEQLVQKGWEIDKITELKELCGKYEEWKTEVLRYAEASGTDVGKYRMALHAVNVPYESREDKIGKYRTSIKKAIRFLQDESQSVRQDEDALETIVRNFEEVDAIIEIKCTGKNHTEKKIFRELGEDAFFYKCEKLIMYVYDKHNIIHDIDNFVRALEKNKGSAGKNIKVYVEQNRKLI